MDAYTQVLGDKHPGALGKPGAEVWGEIWDEIAALSPSFTGNLASGHAGTYTDSGGGRRVNFSGIEHFTVTTGGGNSS